MTIRKSTWPLILLLSACLFSCRKQFLTQEPRIKAFKYYDADFKWSSSSELQLTGGYYYISKGTVSLLNFGVDGMVTSRNIVDSVVSVTGGDLKPDVFGYLKEIENDSIVFTLDAFYFKKPHECAAKIKGDTLLVYQNDHVSSYLFKGSGNVVNPEGPLMYPVQGGLVK